MKYCSHCNSELVVKKTQRKASQLTRPYYYKAYYFCPNCHRIYHDDSFKIINDTSSMFERPLALSSELTEINIWTDGACTNNGTERAKAAWAFVSGDYEKAGLIEGKQTNNIAEAYAIYYALVWAAEKGYKRIMIHSDSQITIHGLQKAVHLVKANQDIFQKIADLIEKNQLSVAYTKVAGHSGDINNERVDRLANGLVAS